MAEKTNENENKTALKTDKTAKEKRLRSGMIIFCLVVLFNPFIKTVDLLPDFIAYFILSRMLTDISYKAPYFAETKKTLRVLGIISLGRLLATVILMPIQLSGGADDIITLAVFGAAVLEIYFGISAVINFTRALGYVSERTSATELYAPFPTRGGRYMQMRELVSRTSIFIVVRSLGGFVPEMLLLYRDPLSGEFNPRVLYPYVFLMCLAFAVIIGVIWLASCVKYIRNLNNSKESIATGIAELVTEEKRVQIESARRLNEKKAALLLMTVSAFLNFEISFGEFRQINLLPTVIFAVMFSAGFIKMTRDCGSSALKKTAATVYISAAAIKFAVQTAFLLVHEYSDFVTSEAARRDYIIVMAAAVLELAVLIFYMAVFAYSMCRYTDGIHGSAMLEKPDRAELEYKKTLRIKAWALAGVSVLTGAVKCARIIINSTINLEYVSTSDTTVGEVFYSDAPWISLVVAIFAIAFGVFSVHYFGTLKDDEERREARRCSQ